MKNVQAEDPRFQGDIWSKLGVDQIRSAMNCIANVFDPGVDDAEPGLFEMAGLNILREAMNVLLDSSQHEGKLKEAVQETAGIWRETINCCLERD